MKNVKTTTAGLSSIITSLGTIIYAIQHAELNPSVIATALTAMLSGIGLIWAKDNK
jgi:hypothetical protein